MIFVNRYRIIQNSEVIKDPTKYWYVEKYVYGMLKETIEVPLGEGIQFTAIDSGYDDDTFYGWSIDGSSTRVTFNSKSTYKNTTSSVKKYLDSENTIKLYAVYSYNPMVLLNTVSIDFGYKNQSYGKTYTYATTAEAKLYFSGYIKQEGVSASGSINSMSGLTFTVTPEYGTGESFTTDGSNQIFKIYPANSHITFTLEGYSFSTPQASGAVSSYAYIESNTPNAHLYDCNNLSYRVISHT